MAGIFSKLKNSFVLRVSLISAVSAFVVVQIVRIVVSYFGFPTSVTRVIAEIALLDFLFVFGLACLIRTASPPDRRLLVISVAWTVGPLLLGGNLFLLATGIILRGTEPSVFEIPIYILVCLATIIWAQISSPFARAWLRGKAEDREAIYKAEQILSWPAKPDEIHEMEAHISPKLYYTFLACILAIIFIVVESLLGEFLDDTFGSVEYIGEFIMALCIAAVIYPAHKRASKYISFDHVSSAGSIATNFKSAVSEVVRALGGYLKMNIRYWYVLFPLYIVFGYVFGWVLRHYDDIFFL